MISLNKIPIENLDKNFYHFADRTISRRKPDVKYLISQLKYHETKYDKNGFLTDFLFRLEDFAYGLEHNGLLDIAGMIYSRLAKLPTTPELKEQFLRGGLRLARKQGDPIHILGRIVDLKKLYEAEGKGNKFYKMLFSEEQTLTGIVENFVKAKINYRTVSKKAATEDVYSYRLAVVKVDIAKKMRSKDRVERLLEAKEIFERLGCEKELKFVNKLLYE